MYCGTFPHTIHQCLDTCTLDQRKMSCQFQMALDFGSLLSRRPRFESLGLRHVLVAYNGPSTKRMPRPQNLNTNSIHHSHLANPIIRMAMYAGYKLGVIVDNVLTCAIALYRSRLRSYGLKTLYHCQNR